MSEFNWSTYKLDVDLIDGESSDVINKKPRHTRMFETFIQFLDTQKIPDDSSLHPVKLETDSPENSHFEFVYYKLLASIELLPEKVKHLVNFKNGLLIKTADKHLSNLLKQLILIIEFDGVVRRLSEEFSEGDSQSLDAKFHAAEKFYENMFVVTSEFTNYKRATTKEQGQHQVLTSPMVMDAPQQQQLNPQQIKTEPTHEILQPNIIVNEKLSSGIVGGGVPTGVPLRLAMITVQQQQAAAAAAVKGPSTPGTGSVAGKRAVVWTGFVEYQEKATPPQMPGQPLAPHCQRLTYALPCQISCSVGANDQPEVNTQTWPSKLVLQLLPRNLIMKLFAILKTASAHVGLHFSQPLNSEGLVKLSSSMAGTYVGCVQFPQTVTPPPPRMMIVIYMPDKRLFMGFVPTDQGGFFASLKSIIEQYKQENMQKQKMLSS